MLLRHLHLDALAQILHTQLAHQLVGDIASHGRDAFHLRGRQPGNDRHHLVGNLDFSDLVFLIYFMGTAILRFRHNKYLLSDMIRRAALNAAPPAQNSRNMALIGFIIPNIHDFA